MDIKGILGKVAKLFGGKAGDVADKAADLGLDTIIDKLQKLAAGADAGDQKSVGAIVDMLKKALGDKSQLGGVMQKCLDIAGKIGNADLKAAVTKLLKK